MKTETADVNIPILLYHSINDRPVARKSFRKNRGFCNEMKIFGGQRLYGDRFLTS
jgi:hypothetical protein